MTNDLKIPILITGGFGFIGINMVRHLLQKGFENLTVLILYSLRHYKVDMTLVLNKMWGMIW